MTVYGIVVTLVVQLVNRLMEPNQVWLAVERVCLQTSLIPFCIRKLELDLQHPKCQVMIVKFFIKVKKTVLLWDMVNSNYTTFAVRQMCQATAIYY